MPEVFLGQGRGIDKKRAGLSSLAFDVRGAVINPITNYRPDAEGLSDLDVVADIGCDFHKPGIFKIDGAVLGQLAVGIRLSQVFRRGIGTPAKAEVHIEIDRVLILDHAHFKHVVGIFLLLHQIGAATRK